jgi:hypothetical protein
MEGVAMVLLVGGYIAALVTGIWLLVVAFQAGIGWGLWPACSSRSLPWCSWSRTGRTRSGRS